MRVTGKITICTDLVSINGQMVDNTKVNLITIRKTVTENTHTQTVAAIKECGRMVYKMAKELSYLLKAKKDMVNGKKEREFAGQIIMILRVGVFLLLPGKIALINLIKLLII